MQKTIFKLSKMDCSAEEQIVRMKLQDIAGIKQLVFSLPERRLEIYHEEPITPIAAALHELNFGKTFVFSETVDKLPFESTERNERRLLVYVLLINAFFFILEITTGFLSHLMGLVADSLDMLAEQQATCSSVSQRVEEKIQLIDQKIKELEDLKGLMVNNVQQCIVFCRMQTAR